MNDIRPALIIIDMINNFDFSHGTILARKTLPIAHSNDLDNQYALTMMENVLKTKTPPSNHEIYNHFNIYPPPPS